MKHTLRLAVAAAAIALATPALAQQTQQQQDDQWAKQVHDSAKDGANTIGTTEDQAFSGNGTGSSYTPDTSTVHDTTRSAVDKGAETFDSATSAISNAFR